MEEYDSSKPTKYLQYLDANNLCGWAMSQPSKKHHGYLLEVDVSYPKELHDLHNDLPFMCTKMKMNGVEKLIPNLYYKRKYIIIYEL